MSTDSFVTRRSAAVPVSTATTLTKEESTVDTLTEMATGGWKVRNADGSISWPTVAMAVTVTAIGSALVLYLASVCLSKF